MIRRATAFGPLLLLSLLSLSHPAFADPGRTVVTTAREGQHRFTVGRELAPKHPGVLSRIYRGRRIDGKREPVAIKLPRGESHSYEREHRVLGEIRDRRVVRSFGLGRVEGRPERAALVMEFAPGEQLGVPYQPWPRRSVGKSVRIATEILRAVRAMEVAGWRHNDLHPGNIQIEQDRSQTIKILDVGHATRADGSRRVSPFYNAEDPGPPDFNADVYSVGALLIHMITGEASRDALAQVESLGGAELRAIIEKAVANNPTDRYRTAQELIDALRPFRFRTHFVVRGGLGEGGNAIAYEVRHDEPSLAHLTVLKLIKAESRTGAVPHADAATRNAFAREAVQTARMLRKHPEVRARFGDVVMRSIAIENEMTVTMDGDTRIVDGHSGAVLQEKASGVRYADLPSAKQEVARTEVHAFADMAERILPSVSPETGRPLRYSRNYRGNYFYDPGTGRIAAVVDHISDAQRR